MKENNATKLAVMARDIEYIKKQIDHIDQQVSSNYVTKQEFEPIRKLTYGLISLILIAFVGAIIKLIIK